LKTISELKVAHISNTRLPNIHDMRQTCNTYVCVCVSLGAHAEVCKPLRRLHATV